MRVYGNAPVHGCISRPTRRGTATRAAPILRAGASALLVLVAGCVNDATSLDGSAIATFRFAIDVRAASARAGYPTQEFALRMQPYVVHNDGTTVLLSEPKVIALGNQPQLRTSVTIEVDRRLCFRDQSRVRLGDPCPLRLDVSLMLSNGGLVLDNQLFGPWGIVPGHVQALDTLRLEEVGLPELSSPPMPLAVGETFQMIAWFRTVRGDSVARPVSWRSENPIVASVDSTGRVTGRAAGEAVVAAHFGRGQSSNGVLIVVR